MHCITKNIRFRVLYCWRRATRTHATQCRLQTIAPARGFLTCRPASRRFDLHRRTPMPKLLVLFDPRSDDMTRLADAVAEGARSVRFAEVDVRTSSDASSASAATTRHRALENADMLAAYDGIIVGAAPAGSTNGAALEQLVPPATNLLNKVGSAFTAAPPGDGRREILWSVLTPMADRGMILVPPQITTSPADELESARAQGKRVAEIVGWVTHARSHHHHH